MPIIYLIKKSNKQNEQLNKNSLIKNKKGTQKE